MEKTQAPNTEHQIRIHIFWTLDVDGHLVPRIHATCICGGSSPNCENTDEAVDRGFAHLDTVCVP